jgi:quercetin dioxygenase-like cupin family protein
MDIRWFGPGHRRPESAPGTRGLSGQVIWNDERGNVSELAFARDGGIAAHENPNTTLFIVVSGGGWVQVGEERTRVTHGEAVVWPPGVPHGAWTEGTEMRAIVVELPRGTARIVEGTARPTDEEGGAEPARGTLTRPAADPVTRDESEGEPW